ncbi:hypothetical protein DFH08DRAFT_844475 [Mycena albidolilacea]|uniref:Secreted protein n=1 Tax=Mycena albidolilacea TaxID=1033008 RepID=A0AAD7AKX8_9AGAR|nr:hypothetical protein DFH08DRAFT_844475 [Mycena albidolilacea]
MFSATTRIAAFISDFFPLLAAMGGRSRGRCAPLGTCSSLARDVLQQQAGCLGSVCLGRHSSRSAVRYLRSGSACSVSRASLGLGLGYCVKSSVCTEHQRL